MSDKLRLGEILVRAGILDRDVLEEAIERVDSQSDLGELLVAEGHLDEGTLLQTIGKALNLNPVRLGDVEPDRKALDLVGREDCAELFLFPVHVEQGRTGAHLHVAMANPADVRAIKRVTRKARMRIRPLVALAREVREAVVKHYGGEHIPGPMDSISRPPDAVSVAPLQPPAESQETPSPSGLFDFGVADLSDLESNASLPPPIAMAPKAPGTQSPLPINDDLMGELDESAASVLDAEPAVPYDRARVAAVRRSMPPGEARLAPPRTTDSPPPRAPTGPMPSPPRLPVSAPLPPLKGHLPQASATGPLPHARPGHVPTDPFGPQTLGSDASTPLPAGLVDATEDGPGIQQLLDQFIEPAESTERRADLVIQQALTQYGADEEAPGERVFAALDRALLRSGSMSGRLTVVLIRQLARRGLVDPDRLLADLKVVS